MSENHTKCPGGTASLPRILSNHFLPCRIVLLSLAMLTLGGWASSARAQGPSQSGVIINEIHCNPDDETELVEFVELYNRGSEAVDLSGWYFDAGLTYTFPAGTTLPADGYVVVTESLDGLYAKWNSGRLPLNPAYVRGPYEGRLDNDGERIALCNAAGDLVDEVEYQIGFPWPLVGDPVPDGTTGTGYSLQLINPSFDNSVAINWASGAPTPLRANKAVFASNARPYVRKIATTPAQPKGDQPVAVTAKVTDANGIAGVVLEYQIVRPGHYIPLRLPAYPGALEADPNATQMNNPDYFSLENWTQAPMRDDGTAGDAVAGDDVYTAVIPGQPHRTLVRYRLKAMDSRGASTSAPYADDPSMNFAYFVYDGVPDYQGFSAATLQTLPVYHLLTRQEDLRQALGYDPADQMPQYSNSGANPARFVYNWYGTFVYDGVVYDNVSYRLRGANGRYLGGNTKRSMRFRFHRGHYFQARDNSGKPYPTQWRSLVTAKGFDNRLTLTFGFNEHINFYLFNKMGVPAPYSHFFHFRVIDDEREAPDPWRGDFWGLSLAEEPYDVRFLEAHNLEKGNLYKLINATDDAKEQQNYQAPYAVSDGSDHDTIQYNLNNRSTPDFIRAHVRLDKWYVYHSLVQAIRHYDYWPAANKNAVWYFEPDYTPENNYLGKMWTLPWDTDATWGPTWNDGIDVVYDSIFPRNQELQPDYYGAIREVRDLLWQRDQLQLLLAEFATPLVEFVKADLVRWLDAPSDAGNYRGLSGPGKQGLPAYVEDMLAFAFEGGYWPGGGVGDGGRAAFLDGLAEGADGSRVPNKPSIAYIGEPNHPINGLRFRTSAFSDPQGSGTFGAMKWRIAEVSPHAKSATPAQNVEEGVLVPEKSEWRYFKGTSEPSTSPRAWRAVDFDDSAWLTGLAPIGFGEAFLATTLSDMRGGYSTLYLRRTFAVDDPAACDTLSLGVLYDDGVNIWINGIMVYQANVASPELPYNGLATSATENAEYNAATLSGLSKILAKGKNVIAVQLLNASLSGSSDAYIDLRLRLPSAPPTTGGDTSAPASFADLVPGNGAYEIETLWESEPSNKFADTTLIPAMKLQIGRTYRVRCRMQDNAGYWSHWSDPVQFTAGRPLATGPIAGLRITELMYNPAETSDDAGFDSEEFEFIELKNIGADPLDLTGVSFTEGVTFAFQNSAITTLSHGQFVLVVRNKEAFAHRYGPELSKRIAGQYEGKLANEGESIRLVDFWTGTIAAFEYHDAAPWPTSADGEGYSLVPLDTALPDEPNGSLNNPANWRPSKEIGGSPARDDS